ncbi:hypothetical protein EUGRSUZ_E03979 [Eucalyptus grandis]|uniref:Uncharacterized protein n=2 Tax=Eucalyptus grandis TaxID=71139 RepID=A0ACC3L0K7_EUCGR|nr:hypothetical protein EUGRSUZ_E03979 [Eucalyptus grandis]
MDRSKLLYCELICLIMTHRLRIEIELLLSIENPKIRHIFSTVPITSIQFNCIISHGSDYMANTFPSHEEAGGDWSNQGLRL